MATDDEPQVELPRDPLAGVPSLKELAERDYVTLGQAVTLTGFTYQTLQKYIHPGKDGSPPRLKAYKVGSQWRITETEMRKFLSGIKS